MCIRYYLLCIKKTFEFFLKKECYYNINERRSPGTRADLCLFFLKTRNFPESSVLFSIIQRINHAFVGTTHHTKKWSAKTLDQRLMAREYLFYFFFSQSFEYWDLGLPYPVSPEMYVTHLDLNFLRKREEFYLLFH